MSQLNRRQALKLFAALGAAGAAGPALAACGSSGSGGSGGGLPPIKVGMLVPQSGIYKSIGDEQTYGFELYLKLNDNKLGGRGVQLVYADEGETAASGKAALDKLLKQAQVQVLSGVANSLVMDAIKDDVEAAQTPLVGSNASPTSLGGVRYIWRTSYVNDEPGQALGKYVADRLGRGSVFLAAADYAAGHDMISGFLKTYRPAGGAVAGDPLYTPFPDNTSFNSVVSKIRGSGANAVFCFYGGEQALDFVKQYRAAGLKQPIYAPGFLTEGSILKQEGDAANGILTAMNYSPDLDNQANRRFVSEYQKAHGGLPSTYAMASYDAAAVLDKALMLAGSDSSPRSINLALGRVGEIDSPRGVWQFNQNRTPQQQWYLRQVRKDGVVLSNVRISDLVMLG